MVTLRVRLGVVLAGAGAASAGGDAVADGDLLGSDEDVFDQQPQYALAVFDGGLGGAGAQPGQEAFQVVGEFEVGVAVGGLGVEGVDLPAEVLLAGAQDCRERTLDYQDERTRRSLNGARGRVKYPGLGGLFTRTA